MAKQHAIDYVQLLTYFPIDNLNSLASKLESLRFFEAFLGQHDISYVPFLVMFVQVFM